MLCRFLLITIWGSFTKTTFIGMEMVVFRGVSRKQGTKGKIRRGNLEKVACLQLDLLWCFLAKLNFKHFGVSENSVLLFPL